jgi:hypothetical protein
MLVITSIGSGLQDGYFKTQAPSRSHADSLINARPITMVYSGVDRVKENVPDPWRLLIHFFDEPYSPSKPLLEVRVGT